MNLSEKNDFLKQLDKFDYLTQLEETELNAIVGGAGNAVQELTYVSPTYVDELTLAALSADVEMLRSQ
jgi:hypothetical protein